MKDRLVPLFASSAFLLLTSCVTNDLPGYSPNRAQSGGSAFGTDRQSQNTIGNNKFDLADLSRAKSRAVVTTGLDSARNPIDATGTVVRNGKIYLHTTWAELPNHEIQAKTELRDPQGVIVHTAHSTFRPQNRAWVSFAWYTFKNTDRPGVWEFSVTLDDTPALKKEFLVREPHGVLGSTENNLSRPAGERISDSPDPLPSTTGNLPDTLNEIPDLEALPQAPTKLPSIPSTRLPDISDPTR